MIGFGSTLRTLLLYSLKFVPYRYHKPNLSSTVHCFNIFNDKKTLKAFVHFFLMKMFILETAMGTSRNAQKTSENLYLKAVKEYLWLIFVKEFSLWKRFDFLHAYSSDYRRLRQLLVTLHGFSKSVITQRREKLNNSVNDSDFGKNKVTFLDLLLKMETEDGQNLTDEDIREEVDTFMFEVSNMF